MSLRWTASLLLLLGAGACHTRPVQGPAETSLVRLGDKQSRSVKVDGDSAKIESLERTVLRVGDTEMSITLDDVKAIQVALLDYLRQSDYEFRGELMRWTGPAFIDPEGTVRIGLWVLGSHGQDIYLRCRERPAPAAMRAHMAHLNRTDGNWTVNRVETEYIGIRR